MSVERQSISIFIIFIVTVSELLKLASFETDKNLAATNRIRVHIMT